MTQAGTKNQNVPTLTLAQYISFEFIKDFVISPITKSLEKILVPHIQTSQYLMKLRATFMQSKIPNVHLFSCLPFFTKKTSGCN
jgi:hypothetical protein